MAVTPPGAGVWKNPWKVGTMAIWVNATTHALYGKYNADFEPVKSDTDGVPFILADGSVAMSGDFDMGGNSIKNLGTQQHVYKEITSGDSPYTILDNDLDYFFFNTTGGDITAILPAIANNIGRVIHGIKTSASNKLILDGKDAELIHGETTLKIYRHRRAFAITPRTSGTTEWTFEYGAPTVRCYPIDTAIPKRPAANPPAEGTENSFPTLDFDDTTDESVFLIWRLPEHYRPEGLVKI